MINNITLINIIGAGGFGYEIVHLLKNKNPSLNFEFYDDHGQNKNIRPIDNLKIKNGIKKYCIITIGDPQARKNIYERIKINSDLMFPNIDFSNHNVYPTSEFNSNGNGNIYMPNSLIGFNTHIGSFNIIGANAGIGHNVTIGDFNFIGPNSFLAGNVKVSDLSKFSFGTFILQNLYLCSEINSMPYTVFYKNKKISGTYYGNPAIKI